MAQARIRTVLDLESSRFEAGLKRAGMQAGAFAKNLRGVGAMIGVSFGAVAAKGLLSWAAGIQAVAKQTGVSTDAIQALTAAGLRNNASQEEVVSTLQRLRKSQGEILAGNKEQIAAWTQLGFSAQQIAGMDLESAFETLSKRLSESGFSAKDAAAATDILGQSWQNMKPLMEELADNGLQKIIDGERMVSEETIKMAKAWDDSLESMTLKAKAFFATGIMEWLHGRFGLSAADRIPERMAPPKMDYSGARKEEAAFVDPYSKGVSPERARQDAISEAARKERERKIAAEDAAAMNEIEAGAERKIRAEFKLRTAGEGATTGMFAEGRGDYLRSIGAGGAVAGDPIQREVLQIQKDILRQQELHTQLWQELIDRFAPQGAGWSPDMFEGT